MWLYIPNPVKDLMKLSFASDINNKASISITDMSGKLIYSKSAISIEKEQIIQTLILSH